MATTTRTHHGDGWLVNVGHYLVPSPLLYLVVGWCWFSLRRLGYNLTTTNSNLDPAILLLDEKVV